MKERILELAILSPNRYPWQKANLEMNRKEIDCILKELGLLSKYERVKLNKLIKFIILKESKDCNNSEEVIKKVKLALSKDIELNADIIGEIQKRMNLNSKENIDIYNSFLNGELDTDGFKNNLQSSLSWLVEVFAIYFAIKEELTIEDLNNKLCEFINKLFSDQDYSKEIKGRLYLNGYIHEGSLTNLKKYLSDYKEEISMLFNLIENEEVNDKTEAKDIIESEKKSKEKGKGNGLTLEGTSKKDRDISRSIINMFLNKPTALDVVDYTSNKKVDVKNNTSKSLLEEPKNEDIEKVKEEKVIKKDISIVDSEELITLSKEKYNKLIESDKEREIKVLKELAHIRNGAVLSELYNAYKNINNISKENLEIILANLFNALNQYGFEAIEGRKLVGENITVNTKDVLKEFIFTNPVNKDGLVEGKIEYLGWSYNGKQVVPMVIKPL